MSEMTSLVSYLLKTSKQINSIFRKLKKIESHIYFNTKTTHAHHISEEGSINLKVADMEDEEIEDEDDKFISD